MMKLKIENLEINFPLTENSDCVEILFGKLTSNKDFKNIVQEYEINILDFLDLEYFDAQIEKFFEQDELNPIVFERHNLKFELSYDDKK